ncbi:MAG: ARPP-1 family domain-containing protein [Candidatus Aminicenantales bacterium]
MDKSVENYLIGMELGAGTSFENMTVFELLRAQNGGPDYITLREAIEKGVFSVTETSEGGSVPELMAVNKGEVPVLLLDGEELRGAKQNRILNTTILVAPKSSTKVPVSCVEHGRWHYEEREFKESGNVMHREMRAVNIRRVSESLRSEQQFRSDQGEIWDKVAELHCAMAVPERTGAMRDVYEAKGADLEGYLKTFRLAEGQKGILVFVDGRPVGMDFVSRDAAFAMLFPKLIKSYAMEAMLLTERRKRGRGKGGDAKAQAVPTAEGAREFLKRAAASDEKKYESVGLGWSYRYAGAGIVGSALAVNDKVVHMAFFGIDEAESAQNAGSMAGSRMRRNFRV